MPRETATPYRLRHLALLLGVMMLAAGAPAARPDLPLLLLVAGFGALNLAADCSPALQAAPRPIRSFPGLLAPIGWALLVLHTGGVRSPFLVGLALEVALAGQFGSTLRVAAVTTISVAPLLLDARQVAASRVVDRALIPGGLLLALGTVSAAGARFWRRREATALDESARLHARLAALERGLPAPGGAPDSDLPIRVGHGLRGVLHSLRGVAGLLEEEDLPAPRRRRLMDLLGAMADRVEELSATALGRHETPVESSCRLETVLAPFLSRFAASWPGVVVRSRGAAGEGRVGLSRSGLEELLHNVLTNAAESMNGRGTIEIDLARPSPGHWRLRVRDHGPGIAEGLRSRLGAPGASNRGPGRGYGLYLVRRLVESAGGRLDIRSAPGGGTVVDIGLPAALLAGESL